MECTVTKDEVISVLKSLGRGKSLGLDGRTIEIFLHFQDIMIDGLTDMVEDSRIHGWVSTATNATFITLIPKIDKPISFSDFHPLSLCNTTYKLISKIIGNRLKPFLSSYITTE